MIRKVSGERALGLGFFSSVFVLIPILGAIFAPILCVVAATRLYAEEYLINPLENLLRFSALGLALACSSALHAKIFLLLDDHLKGSAIEQSIYKFVPRTNATEVELNYARDFIKSEAAFEFGRKMKAGDRAIYIGTERWPDDAYLSKFVGRREWFDMLGKISFFDRK